MKKWIRKCDNCGKINPIRLYGNDRLCGECADQVGFYKKKGWKLGANGKVGFYKLQIPIQIRWRGWLELN